MKLFIKVSSRIAIFVKINGALFPPSPPPRWMEPRVNEGIKKMRVDNYERLYCRVYNGEIEKEYEQASHTDRGSFTETFSARC